MLVSKWATASEDGTDDVKKDEAALKSPKSPKKLTSKWADAPSEPEELPALSASASASTSARNDHHKGKKRSPKKHRSGPNEADSQYKDRNNFHGSPADARAVDGDVIVGDEDEDEEIPGVQSEMSEAAKEFARRLNIETPKSPSKRGDVGNSNRRKSTDRLSCSRGNGKDSREGNRPGNRRIQEDNHSDNWEDDSAEEEEDEDEEKLPEMGSAGRSFAARLGLVAPESPKQSVKLQSRNKDRLEASRRDGRHDHKNNINININSNKSNHNHNQTHGNDYNEEAKRTPKKNSRDNGAGASKYMTPRQRREEDARILEETKKKEHDEQLKKEVSAMFEKMADKHTNWADIDDDDF